LEAVPQAAEDFGFLYRATDELNKGRLSQGDILARSEECVQAISAAHQYYAEAPDYTHFVVITQSCDLVRRSGKFNAPYITIAAAKKMSDVLEGALSKPKEINKSTLRYRTPSDMKRGRQLIERYLNNTESNYFFLPKSETHGIKEDLVVFLHLSIALRKEHYDVLARAKIASIRDVFQAKLGWLKGNIYSRVATPDLEEERDDGLAVKSDYYNQYMPELELSGHQADRLKAAVRKMEKEAGRDLLPDEVITLASQLPSDIEIIAEKLVEKLASSGIIPRDQEKLALAQRAIANSPVLKGIIGNG
jgi:hypothetical protein